MSREFYHPFDIPLDRPEWYECPRCRHDLRSGGHDSGCTLSPDDQNKEVERVKYVVSTFFKTRGLGSREGGKNG